MNVFRLLSIDKVHRPRRFVVLNDLSTNLLPCYQVQVADKTYRVGRIVIGKQHSFEFLDFPAQRVDSLFEIGDLSQAIRLVIESVVNATASSRVRVVYSRLVPNAARLRPWWSKVR